MRQFTKGNELSFSATFVDPMTGAPANPTDVLLRLRDPNGVETDPPLINPATGVFSTTFTPQVSGTWYYRWQGTGSINAAREGIFAINASDFGS